MPALEDNAALGDTPAVSKPAFGNPVAAQDDNAMIGDATAAVKAVESKPVSDGRAKGGPAEIVASEPEAKAKATPNTEAEAEAAAKEKAEALRMMEEAAEPQRAPLKAMGEKKVSNNLLDYGEHYSSSDE